MGVDEKWKGFQDLSDQLEKQPTFPFCEATFFFLAFLCLLHATRHNLRHVVVLAGALIGGTANDLFFMTLPFVDNFWHAQGTVMITPRLPLYIPLCLYLFYVYSDCFFLAFSSSTSSFGTVLSRRTLWRSLLLYL